MTENMKMLGIISNVLRIFVPLLVFYFISKYGKYIDRKQFIISIILVAIVTEAIKILTLGTWIGIRPNGNLKSFPSGHSSIMFQTAIFLQMKYGWKYGLPAMLVAGCVVYIRVMCLYHHPRDVVAGIAVALIINMIVIRKPKTKKAKSLISRK